MMNLDLKQQHIIIQRRYEILGAINDLFIAIWFLIGSFFFLSDSLVTSGTWLFIVGSAQLLIKPTLKLISLIHVKKVYDKYA
ncbi:MULTISPECIES: YrhK family protein [Pasteurellaceae]|uniref:YrhK family protein n=1 Tax=Pasteurella atlantica TaxID=2827233 RepID=A0AAW8CJX9_9PAST|nr:YrhK family protein [Pasteurella atlantica]MBR0572703.1 YrhK family protein [Pasteurella atlantica]MDP8038648.1 YrhK family protein [Pasteurella atlantica]MDP8040740.1 YrhK family protein [Pasteurella atlantica]MDP8042875.1 YrhK family protein [Pasteurella atlantica]MDP8044962.1 YrhK family protein [Pasteurella atlantica]